MTELICYDPGKPEGAVVEREDGTRVKYVTARDYYLVRLDYSFSVVMVFLSIAPQMNPQLDQKTRRELDDEIADRYWNFYEGCLLPPDVRRVLRRAAEQGAKGEFLGLLETARRDILNRDVDLQDAFRQRVARRIQALRMGLDRVLTEYQVAVAEATIDLFLVERLAMEDVIRAERERGERTRAEMIEHYDNLRETTLERKLTMIFRPQTILQAIPAAMLAELEEFNKIRKPYHLRGVFADSEEANGK